MDKVAEAEIRRRQGLQPRHSLHDKGPRDQARGAHDDCRQPRTVRTEASLKDDP